MSSLVVVSIIKEQIKHHHTLPALEVKRYLLSDIKQVVFSHKDVIVLLGVKIVSENWHQTLCQT